jgi:hypothetical protein
VGGFTESQGQLFHERQEREICDEPVRHGQGKADHAARHHAVRKPPEKRRKIARKAARSRWK